MQTMKETRPKLVAEKAFIITQDDLAEFARVLSKNIKSKDELMAACRALTTVSVDGVEITLEPGLLTRLKSRCIRREFPEFLRETIRKQLFDYVGW